MQVGRDGFFHLTYCTKIHPTHGWSELFTSIRKCVPPLKRRLACNTFFGLGLRLSDAESRQLLAGDNLAKFQDFLAQHHIYVFTLNGFPYGPFRGPSVKAQVFSPDWREEARVIYTERLIHILARLLPAGTEGSISTLPLAYKPTLPASEGHSLELICRNLARLVLLLMHVQERTGQFIHLDLEPEADGLLQESADVGKFFQKWLLPYGAPLLSSWTGISLGQAENQIRQHIQICLDTCHLAVAYENPAAVLDLLAQNGLRVGKMQVTSGIKFNLPAAPEDRKVLIRALKTFAGSPYLHQVTAQRRDGSLYQYRDLEEALPQLSAADDWQWRIHFHMPLYAKTYEGLSSTQDETREWLLFLKEKNFCRHLELETYTWEVLPPAMRVDIIDSLEREYRWTLHYLGLEILI